MSKEKYHLFTFDVCDSGGCLRSYNYKFIGEYETHQECLDKAKSIGCNVNHINYSFCVYKTTYLDMKK